MTREKAKELLPIVQAYAEGKEIEYRGLDGAWLDNDDMDFNPNWTYRIKPEPKYRPFKDIDELIATWQKMMGYSAKANTRPLIWVKNKTSHLTFAITGFGNIDTVFVADDRVDLSMVFSDYTFLDESPFGCIEE